MKVFLAVKRERSTESVLDIRVYQNEQPATIYKIVEENEFIRVDIIQKDIR